MAAWTSRAAASMLRERSNWRTMLVLPRPEAEVSSVTPALRWNWRSRGGATEAGGGFVGETAGDAIEEEIDDRGGVERQDLTEDQTSDNRDAKRPAEFAAGAAAQG